MFDPKEDSIVPFRQRSCADKACTGTIVVVLFAGLSLLASKNSIIDRHGVSFPNSSRQSMCIPAGKDRMDMELDIDNRRWLLYWRESTPLERCGPGKSEVGV